MSLTPGFAADARLQFQALDPRWQEIALDIVDRLAVDPATDGEHIADQIYEGNGVRHYVFVHAIVERGSNRLTVIGLGYSTRGVS